MAEVRSGVMSAVLACPPQRALCGLGLGQLVSAVRIEGSFPEGMLKLMQEDGPTGTDWAIIPA